MKSIKFQKQIKPSMLWFSPLLFVLCSVFVIAGIWFASLYSSLDIQNNDDYIWYQALLHMYEATTGQLPLSMLVPNAYYGLPFWLISFASAWPFFAVHSEAGTLIAPRVAETFFAAASLAVIALGLRIEFARRLPAENHAWLLLTIPVILAMPIWWVMAGLNHPQHMLVFSELCVITFLLSDRGKVGKGYWRAVIAAGLGFSLKLEAAMLAPIFICYLILSHYFQHESWKSFFQTAAMSIALALVIWILFNPYLLTPLGLTTWLRTSGAGIVYVFTNGTHNIVEHRPAPTISIERQLSMLSANFYPALVIGMLISILMVDGATSVCQRKFTASALLAPYVLISLAICLTVANTSPYYWITAMLSLLYATVPVVEWCKGRPIILLAIIAVALLAQGATVGMRTAELLSERASMLLYSSMLDRTLPASEIHRIADEQAIEVAPYLKGARRIIISPNTNLNFMSLGIPYLQEIYGCLTPAQLELDNRRFVQSQVDTVILRKNDRILTNDCPETMALIKAWKGNASSSFRLVEETNYLMVFRSAKASALPD